MKHEVYNETLEKNMAYFNLNNGLCHVQVPADWIQLDFSEVLMLSNPERSITVTATTYEKNGSFEDFCAFRFDMVQFFYVPQTDIYAIKHGLARQYEGQWPESDELSYHNVAAIEVDDVFICLTITTNREQFFEHKDMFQNIFDTVKINRLPFTLKIV